MMAAIAKRTLSRLLAACLLLSIVFSLAATSRSASAATTVYQAENATIFHGVVESNHAGFTGTGFVNYNNEVGSYVEWVVSVPQAGTAKLTFRFANGTTSNRPMAIRVNGAVVNSNLAFNGTGAWSTWSIQSLNAALKAGTNTVRATATTANGGPNVDRLDVVDSSNPTATHTATPTRTPTPTATPTPPAGWVLRWTGDPARGLATFEGVEDDRANSHPAGQPHIYVEGTNFRFNMHLVDRDGSDRQRNEVKGMNVAGVGDIIIRQGETWRFTYEMFMPSSLTGGEHFGHIHQQKMVSDAGSSGLPLATLSTSRSGSTEVLVMRHLTGGDFNPIPLAPLRNKWIVVELEYKFDFANRGGYVRMVIRADGTTVTDKTRTSVNMWANEGTTDRRMRPKWGIYRSIESSGLKDTHLLLRNMKAYQKQ